MALTVLALESSCDETAVAIVRDGEVIANHIATQEIHATWGGVVPELASRLHQRTLSRMVHDALERAAITPRELSAIAATTGPGLIGALLVGASYGKGMATALNIPFLGVNHLEGHLWSAAVNAEPLPLPALVLLVSGGHTELVAIKDFGRYSYLGATLDDAAGEAFDKVGGLLGIPYPAGAELSRLAAEGDDRAVPFKVATTEHPLDFSFSGLKSAALREIQQRKDADAAPWQADLAASFQRAVVRQLAGRVERALDRRAFASLSLGGGVAANRALRGALERIARERGLPLHVPPFEYCTDNAAMIGWVAWERLRRGQEDPLTHPADPNLTLEAAHP